MKLLHVVGARPNFPKLAPVYRAARLAGLHQVVCHTGQHYDEAMSDGFFRDLELSPPDINLGVGSASHAVQTGRLMEGLERVVKEGRYDWIVVYGDVNSTLAAALVAAKEGVALAHVEAGLRSYDRSMPEEVNRIVTDRLANLLLTPSRDAGRTLREEGEPEGEIVFVGNVMIDSLMMAIPRAVETGYANAQRLDGTHVVVTLHRPSNVDDSERLSLLIAQLEKVAERRRVLFPMHPRTRGRLESLGLRLARVEAVEPLSYLHMIDAVRGAWCVITDSGGLQEETTALGVPCFTLRPNTERPVTVAEGTNQLVLDANALAELVERNPKRGHVGVPEGWDGKVGLRIVDALISGPRVG